MRIDEALGGVFKRTYPVLDNTTSLLMAAYLLRFHQTDAIPIVSDLTAFEPAKERLCVAGYSVLAKLLEIDPSQYGSVLNQPCVNSALAIPVISAESELAVLLKIVNQRRFAFAWVEGDPKLWGLVTLRHILALYRTGAIDTQLKIREVASPDLFKMSAEKSLTEVLREMFSRRHRRVIVSETGRVVSDRRIISYVLSPQRLGEVAYHPNKILDLPLGEVWATEPPKIDGETSVKGALKLLPSDECLICESGIVTPWDLVIKVWEKGELRIRELK